MNAINVSRLSVSSLRTLTQQVITNARSDADILSRLQTFSYGIDELDEGQAYLDAFSTTARNYQEIVGQEKSALDARNDHVKAFRKGLLDLHVDQANVAFYHDSGSRTKLRLRDVNSDRLSLSEWMTTTKDFYDILLDDSSLLADVSERGGTRESLEEGREMAAKAERLNQIYAGIQAEREQTRRTRDEQRRPVVEWIRELQNVARRAFKDRPDILEQLAFEVPS